MTKATLPIANGFYESDSLPISAQECVNWYPNVVQSPALSPETLFGTPGVEEIATSGVDQQFNRGSAVVNGVPYFVNGDGLYKLAQTFDAGGVPQYSMENVGTIPGDKLVWMAHNGTQLMVLVPTDGAVASTGYIYNTATDVFAQITDADFIANGQPQTTVFIDGYFVLTTDQKKFIISALNDGLSYNALDFGSAEADPDDIVAPIVFKNQLFIGGSTTTEAFQNLPSGADFPFQRTGLFLDKGIIAPFSVINASDTFMFIGRGANEAPAIWSFAGNTMQKVSTTAIDAIIQSYSEDEIRNSFSWSYAQKGAYFVGFSLPDTTLVIDTITGRWHERKSRVFNDYTGDFDQTFSV